MARPLKGQTLGVLGTGDIGQHVAGVAKAFGMVTLGLVRDTSRTNFDDTTRDVDEVLRQSDVILSALPSTPATRGLLDGGADCACTKRPMLINVGRGDLVTKRASSRRSMRAGFARHVLGCLRDRAAPGRFTALEAGRRLRDAPRGGAEPPGRRGEGVCREPGPVFARGAASVQRWTGGRNNLWFV